MSNQKFIELEGVVQSILPNTRFLIKLENSAVLECHIGGKMRMHYIKLLKGDRVRVKINAYDLKKGIIIYRFKKAQ